MPIKLKVTGGNLDVEFEEGSLLEEAQKQLKKAAEKEDAETKDKIREAKLPDDKKFIPQLGDKTKVKI